MWLPLTSPDRLLHKSTTSDSLRVRLRICDTADHRGKRPIGTPSLKWVVCSTWWLVFAIELVVGSMINSMTVATLEPEKQHGHARD